MKWDNPFLDTLRWALLGGIIGVILYLGHLVLLHEDTEEVDDHSSFYNENAP